MLIADNCSHVGLFRSLLVLGNFIFYRGKLFGFFLFFLSYMVILTEGQRVHSIISTNGCVLIALAAKKELASKNNDICLILVDDKSILVPIELRCKISFKYYTLAKLNCWFFDTDTANELLCAPGFNRLEYKLNNAIMTWNFQKLKEKNSRYSFAL